MESIHNINHFWQIYILAVTAIFGLVIGSFLNVVSLRLFSEESIVFPGSKCPKCQVSIKWYDNIPVISYILLRGKCRNCRESVSIQYPVVEISTTLLFMGIIYSFGINLKSVFLLILTCFLIIITITDLKEKLIFDITSMPLIPLGLVYNFFNIGQVHSGMIKIPFEGIHYTLMMPKVFISALIGAIIGAAFFELFSRLGLLIVGEYAFGAGDTIIGAALGAWFGWKMILLILLISFILQLIIGLPLILINMYKDKDYKSIISVLIMIFSIFIPSIGKNLGVMEHLAGSLITVLLALGMAIAGTIVVLGQTKERKSFTFIAFGPALVIGGFIVMFRGQEIISWCLKNYMHG